MNTLILDSIHDTLAIHQKFQSDNIQTIIDLNLYGTKLHDAKDYTLDSEVFPFVPLGLRMHSNGIDNQKDCAKYLYPKTKYAERLCTCITPCTTSSYGRIIIIALRSNPRHNAYRYIVTV